MKHFDLKTEILTFFHLDTEKCQPENTDNQNLNKFGLF